MELSEYEDDKLAAVLNRLDKRAEKREKSATKEKYDRSKPPKTFEEFLEMEELEDWPVRLTSEGPLALEKNDFLFESPEEVMDILREAAPLQLNMFDEIEERLHNLEVSLKHYADMMVEDKTLCIEDGRSSRKSVDSEHKRELVEKVKKKKTMTESLAEMRKKTVEFCIFPGFRSGELTELPAQMEAPQLLHRVTKAQDFNSGFKKFWKKIFLSEASVAIMQDTFWWSFLNKYDNSHQEDKDKLFNRIADSFVALFFSINPEIKDKFFQVYADCLGQAIYAAYCEAFPESLQKFNENFKTELSNLTWEWVSGVKPPPNSSSHWNLLRLLKKHTRGRSEKKGKDAHEETSTLSQIQKVVNKDLDIESFEKMVQRLGESGSRAATANGGLSREATKLTTISGASLPTGPYRPICTSRMANCGTPRKEDKQSHQIGPGPEMERVLFNTLGCSPLVAHFLHMRQLQDLDKPSMNMKRTEIVKLPLPAPTYKEVIANTINKSDTLNKEYQKICDSTDFEISVIEKRKQQMNREIDNLQKRILFIKNPNELKIMSEKILELMEQGQSSGITGPNIEDSGGDPDPASQSRRNTLKLPEY